MNLNPWKNDQIEPHWNGKYDSGQQHNWLIHHFLPIMDGKMGPYPPKWAITPHPPKKKKMGGWGGGGVG